MRAALGDGRQFGVQIHYSDESAGALEVGGGIFHALPLLGSAPFLVVNGDTFTDIDFGGLDIGTNELARLVLVPNPDHHPNGDFALRDGMVETTGTPRLTYSGIGVFRPELFAGCSPGRFPLLPLLQLAIAARRLGGARYDGAWTDVGTVRAPCGVERVGAMPLPVRGPAGPHARIQEHSAGRRRPAAARNT